MDTRAFYTSPEWRELRERVLARDQGRCTVARILGGQCSPNLHVHHIESIEDRPELALSEDNCATACATHHPIWEALRRAIRRARGWRACPHEHPTRAGRIACERKLNRDRVLAV